MVEHYYRNVHAVVFVYDVTKMASFRNLQTWIEVGNWLDTLHNNQIVFVGMEMVAGAQPWSFSPVLPNVLLSIISISAASSAPTGSSPKTIHDLWVETVTSPSQSLVCISVQANKEVHRGCP